MKEHNNHEAWLQIVEYASSNWSNSASQTQLLSQLLGKKDLAIVIDFIIGTEYAQNWIHSKIPALDYLSPIECLENETTIERLKMILMRMH